MWCARRRLLRREHGGHPPAFHRRRLLDLAHVGQLFQDRVDDPPALLDVLHLPAAELHPQEHLVAVFEELAGLVDPGVDVVGAGLGPDPKLLELLLVGLLGLLLGLGVLGAGAGTSTLVSFQTVFIAASLPALVVAPFLLARSIRSVSSCNVK